MSSRIHADVAQLVGNTRRFARQDCVENPRRGFPRSEAVAPVVGGSGACRHDEGDLMETDDVALIGRGPMGGDALHRLA